MEQQVATATTPRRWQDVRAEQGVSLRVLGEMVGRRHSTMLAYSCGVYAVPQKVLERIAAALGEPVR